VKIKNKLPKTESRKFATKLILGFPMVGLVWSCLIYFFSNSNTFNLNIAYWIGSVGITAGLLSLISPMMNVLIWTVWNRLIAIVDTVITWSTLPIFYYIFFCPFALLIRLFGKATMQNQNKNKVTFWKDVSENTSKTQYLRQF
jgi:hypothetical protein